MYPSQFANDCIAAALGVAAAPSMVNPAFAVQNIF